ncbi:hypothetical protein EVAR_86683_1 [Eumeta japonica]|uniref:Uncharacterized protein n=1 Tax=Eumeta variegata TaxID=151549 RepID=A0A4C1Y006_EUMVA|nr:hypothetical protein EVAR_86683_1 [Eumeta japonica]
MITISFTIPIRVLFSMSARHQPICIILDSEPSIDLSTFDSDLVVDAGPAFNFHLFLFGFRSRSLFLFDPAVDNDCRPVFDFEPSRSQLSFLLFVLCAISIPLLVPLQLQFE